MLDAYRNADIFVLPCRVSRDGDRDGLPNVLLEAQSQRVACLSTRVSGIPELIVDGVTGLLVDRARLPRWRSAGATHRRSFAAGCARDAGFARTTKRFSLHSGTDLLAHRFALSLAAS